MSWNNWYINPRSVLSRQDVEEIMRELEIELCKMDRLFIRRDEGDNLHPYQANELGIRLLRGCNLTKG